MHASASLLIYREYECAHRVFSLEMCVGQEFGFALERPLAAPTSVSAEARAVVALVLLQLGEVMRHLHEI